jgi:hypothetical protein
MKDNKTRYDILVVAGNGVGFYLNLHRKSKMHTSPFSMASTLQTSLKAAVKIIRQIDGQQLMSDAHMDEQFF